MPKSIFFLSTGRCGTNFLYRIFKEYYPELNIDHQTQGSRIINIISNLPIPILIKKNLIKNSLYIYKGKSKPNSTIDPLLSMAIFYLLKNNNIDNDNIKIIHLVRDPRTFVASFMNWKNSSIKRKILHHFIPFWQPSPRFDNDIPFKAKLKFNKFKQFCYVWNYKNDLFWKTFSKNENYKLVKLEDITESQHCFDKLLELTRFLNLPARIFSLDNIFLEKINKSEKRHFPNYENWLEEDKKYLKKTCGKLMNLFGY